MLLAIAALVIVTGAMFFDLLVTAEPVVVSDPHCDLTNWFLSARQFGFDQLARGNLALWDPHVYGGVPFFGDFQSGLLYGPNWLFLLVPVTKAINATVALHVLILGLGMLAWGRLRGLSIAGSLLGAVVVMFGGAHFMHIYAGHLSNLCTMAWAPLLLAAVDGCLDRRRLPWALAGALVVAMMVLAGHPQYVFFTGVAVAIYLLARLPGVLRRQDGRWPLRTAGRAAGLLILLVAGGLALAAVQVASGLAATAGSVRTGGLQREMAGMFSFPPINLLTLVAPWFYGGTESAPYWGKWYQWEMTLFVGVAGLLLGIVGIIRGRMAGRWAATAALAGTLLLAMGSYTPLFEVLYRLPVFNMMRGLSKFTFQASLFLGLLAGAGLDAVVSTRRRWLPIALPAAAGGLAALAAAVWIHFVAASGDLKTWRDVVWGLRTTTIGKLQEVYLDARLYNRADFLRDTAAKAAFSLTLGGAILLTGAGLLMLSRRWRWPAYALALLAAGEVIFFAANERPSFTPEPTRTMQAISAKVPPGDFRIINELNPHEATASAFYDAWGNSPDVRQRWAEYYCVATGRPLTEVSQYANYGNWERRHMLAAARVKYVMVLGPRNQLVSFEILDTLPRLNLVPDWRVVTGVQTSVTAGVLPGFDPGKTRDKILAMLADPQFDFRRTVLLERDPGLGPPRAPAAVTPLPPTGEGGPQGRVRVSTAPASAPATPLPPTGEGGPQGRVRVLDSSTDSLTVEADVPAPCILLITDAYDPHWKATALPGSGQQSYTLMSGDWAFQAVPLTAGRHRIRIGYRPEAFVAGTWISLGACLLCAGAWGLWWLARRRSAEKMPAATE